MVVFFFFFLHYLARGILVLCLGIEPLSLALAAQSFNLWTTREVLDSGFNSVRIMGGPALLPASSAQRPAPMAVDRGHS